MMRQIVVLIIVLTLLTPFVAAAQEIECDPAEIATNYSEQLAAATNVEDLESVQTMLRTEIAKCRGLSFSGSEPGVIGPYELPTGIYILHVENISVKFTELEGDCDTPFVSTGLGAGDQVIESGGCLLLAQFELRDGAEWLLEYETVQLTQDQNTLAADDLTNAWEAIFVGDPEPAKALACEEDHPNIEAAAEAMGAAAGVEGADPSVSCEVDGDTATCELTLAGQTTSITSFIVNGQICGGSQSGE